MIGQTISHYKILSKLGEGGMGVVYKAEDTKLRRTVALKFLPPELTRDKSAKTRFIHEAQAASALQHHNICTIHEIDETKDGRLFIAMDSYDGETLKEKIARGPLRLDDAVDIASQVAAGLSKAHDAGMVHRDIKPANIMVTNDGVVKLLDFGIAKLAGSTKVTRTGTTVGTVAYMSPEQATGRELNARSDIWSLGVVLYEMLTGQSPFKGDHEQALIYQIVNGEPEPLTKYRDDIPGDVAAVVDKALQKDPGKRHQTIGQLRNELSARVISLGSPPSPQRRDRRLIIAVPIAIAAIAALVVVIHFRPSPRPSDLRVAVFDFSFLAEKPDPITVAGLMAAIQVGLADANEYTLVSPEYLSDIQRRKFGLVSASIPAEQKLQVAREAKASLMVTGEVVKGAEGSQVTWRLIETQRGKVLKAAKVDKDRWSDQADEVIRVIAVTLLAIAKSKGGPSPEAIVEKTSENADAYRQYAAALVATEAGHFDDARRDLLLAVKMDTTFALAYFALSRNYSPNSEMSLAQASAKRAWDLRSRLGRKERLLLTAHQLHLDYKFVQAVNAYQDVLGIWPDNKEALIGRAQTHLYFRSWRGARASAEEGLRFYPNEHELQQILAAAMSQLGEFGRALEIARKTTDLRMGSIDAMGTLGDIYLRMAQPDSAANAYERTLALEPQDIYSAMGLSWSAYGRGDLGTAIQMQERLLRDPQYTEAKRTDLRSATYVLGLPVLYADAGRLQDASKLQGGYSGSLPGYIYILPYAGLAAQVLPLLAEDRERAEQIGPGATAFSSWFEACCMARVGEFEKAEVIYEKLNRFVEANPDLPRGHFQRNLELAALIALAKKEPRDALDNLDELFKEGFLRLGPGEILILEAKAEALAQAGQLDDAISVLQELVRVYGSRALAHFQLGDLFEKAGRYDEARGAYSRCLGLWSEADPDYPYPHQARSRLNALK